MEPTPPSSMQTPRARQVLSVRRIPRRHVFARLRSFVQSPNFKAAASPLEMQLLGRMLLHAALVGAAAGFVGSAFFWALELVQRTVLENLGGYVPLRASGEAIGETTSTTHFRPWLVAVLPAIGALLGGTLSWFAPEIRGGGSDATIDAFHNHGGIVRRRVPLLKGIASVLTLGLGGSGGREGPTMQIGGALGSVVGRYLRVTERERRILLVAGTAAGMAAVFRTPLGAALLAVEVLHRDDFESDALVPSVLASVVSYSVFISFFGESTLFAHAARYPFIPEHLPLYIGMAILVSLVAAMFLGMLDGVKSIAKKLPVPDWTKPALGGLALGALATPILIYLGPRIGGGGQGLGILGGGYGAAQVAITGAPWLQAGWRGVELLLLLGIAKMLATSLTVGSGGSAGDFGPSLVIGGIFGGAIGKAAQLLLHDPRIDPGAFALVGMGTLYGGLAHVPIASLVMTCELAGSYDLLVPLMLCEGIAFVLLRNRSIYHAQVATKRDSPAHRDDFIFDVLKGVRVSEIVVRDRAFASFRRNTPSRDVILRVAQAEWQDTFPVLDDDGALVGLISADILRTMTSEPEAMALAIADDLMSPPLSVDENSDLHSALEQMLSHGVRELVVTDAKGKIVSFLDEAEITLVYHAATRPKSMTPPEASP